MIDENQLLEPSTGTVFLFSFTALNCEEEFLEAKKLPDQSSARFMVFKNPKNRRMIGDHCEMSAIQVISPFLQGPDDSETFLHVHGVVSCSLI